VAVYVHHSKKGPDLVWDQVRITRLLGEVRYDQGRIRGRMEDMGTSLREEACRQVYSYDTISFAGAGGERFAAMIREAARELAAPLTMERLLRWHAELYPAVKKTAAQSNVHFQHSAGEGPEGRLGKLIHWGNSATDTDPVIKAAVAQLWLVVIRPFESGNDRLAELVMESLLARANQNGERFYSVAGQMRSETREYETFLSARPGNPGQPGNPGNPPDATPWIEWFLGCMGRAIANSNETLAPILEKHRFWARCAAMPLNDRQRMALERMVGREETNLTSSKWAAMTNTSQDTAGRDINDLVQRGVLTKDKGGGRSTSYTIAWTH
jgi:Fic family protein